MKIGIQELDRYLQSLNSWVVILLSTFLVLVLGVLDYFLGPIISFSIFYVGPIALAAWYQGKSQGVIIALLSTAVWLIVDLALQSEHFQLWIPVWNSFVRFGFFIIITLLLSSLRQRLVLEEKRADTDGLTGLANARSFYESVAAETVRAERYRHPLTIAYFDLDNFKSVNDLQGHDAGDEVLCRVAEIMGSHVRQSDVMARLGGDEFAGLFPETGYEAAQTTIEKLIADLNLSMEQEGWPISFSVGAVTFEKPMDSVRQMVKAADDLMYHVKKQGKKGLLIKRWSGTSLPA